MISKNDVVKWIKQYFEENGPTAKAVIGISGGKDSTVAAALCVEALGADRVVGVRMPQHYQEDENDALRVCEILGIESYRIDIGPICDELYFELNQNTEMDWNKPVVTTNVPARMRMVTLYAVAGAVGGRVCNTSNLSERLVGYSTKWGDGVGDFGPLRQLVVAEVLDLGRQLGLPEDLVVKPPADGLSGMTDEENLGVSYDDIDAVALYGYNAPILPEAMDKIQAKAEAAEHKWLELPCFFPQSELPEFDF